MFSIHDSDLQCSGTDLGFTIEFFRLTCGGNTNVSEIEGSKLTNFYESRIVIIGTGRKVRTVSCS